MSHTPGPWNFPKHGPKAVAYSVYDASGNRVATTIGFTEVTRARIADDARLIAAAPDLLAALEEMIELRDATLRSHVTEKHERDIVRDAIAAIAKAKGEA